MAIRIATKPTFIDETPPSPTPAMMDYTEKVAGLKHVIPERQRHDRPGRPPSGKVRVTLLLSPDVIEKFKATGPGWQARMNEALKAARV